MILQAVDKMAPAPHRRGFHRRGLGDRRLNAVPMGRYRSRKNIPFYELYIFPIRIWLEES